MVPLIRMNCRSRPTCSSILRAASRPSQRLTVAEMIVAKQRHGATGKVTMKFDPSVTRFSDYAGY